MIDFQDVKKIIIPEGEVSIITRGSEILWKKQTYKQQLEYLESTGTQYIDTNYPSGNNIKYQIVASILETKASSDYKGFFGTSIAPEARCGSGFYNGKIRVQFGSGGAVYDTNYHDCNYTGYANPTTYELSKNGFYINDGLEWKPKASLSNSTKVSVYLFNTNAELEYSGTLSRVYSFKLWDNGNLVRDFIPVLDMNDVPCMYDKVTDTYFYNKGTGQFKFGYKFEDEYQVLDYIESNGTQYIDTGVYPANITRLEMEAQYTVINKRQALMGCYSNASYNTFAGTNANSVYENFFIQWSWDQYGGSAKADLNKHIFSFDKSTSTFTVDSSTYKVESDKTDVNDTLYLFATHKGSTIDRQASARVYYLKMYNGSNIVRDFVPCLRKTDGKIGMYDYITKTFFITQETSRSVYSLRNENLIHEYIETDEPVIE